MPSTAVPSKPGLLFVSSKILNTTNLPPIDFCSWYENTHIQEVQATGSISHTHRYESLSFISEHRGGNTLNGLPPDNRNCSHDFLTLYHMPDLSFRETAAFKGLAGQSRPSEELVEGIFEQAEFCTRFCENRSDHERASTGDGPREAASFLVTIGIPSAFSTAEVLAKLLAQYGRRTGYRIREQSILSAFQRSYLPEPANVIVLEMESARKGDDVLRDTETLEGLEVGFWGLRKTYDGSERTPASWPPSYSSL